jgi:regulatory protein YycI of two-component signal transduction system YycFG
MKRVSFEAENPQKSLGLQIEPLFDPMTKAKLFHIASYNLHDAKILTRNIMADQAWFTKVMAEIYRTYAQLASSIAPNLKRKLDKSIHAYDDKSALNDVCAYLESDFFFGMPGYFIDQQNLV